MPISIRIFLQQTVRKKSRFALNIVLLCAVTVFFVVSLNLYHNSRANLQAVENAYTTIATMEIYGDVNKEGDLVQPSAADQVGRFLLTRYGYDLSPLQQLPMVQNVDLRYRCAAYIPGQISLDVYASEMMNETQLALNGLQPTDVNTTMRIHMLRFRLSGDEPVEISRTKAGEYYRYDMKAVDIEVLETTHPQIEYKNPIGLTFSSVIHAVQNDHDAEIRRLNRSQEIDKLILYPNVEYVLFGASETDTWFRKDPDTGLYSPVQRLNVIEGRVVSIRFMVYNYPCLYEGAALHYSGDSEYYTSAGIKGNVPYCIQRWEDVQSDPELAAYFDALWQATAYSTSSFAVTLTSDIRLLPAWQVKNMFLQEGRMITEEEYDSGAKVCMVSTRLAERHGWKLGDKLDMHLYHEDFPQYTGTTSCSEMWASMYMEDFFDEGQYKIVGIYGQSEGEVDSEAAPEVFAQPWNAIYIPENSAPHAPALEDRAIQASLLTFHLKNGTIKEFQAAVEKLGLTEQKSGQYQLKFSYFDQGYDKIKGGLVEMNRNAVLLLALSLILLLVTMILMAFLFSRQHKHSAGILRMLGGSKKQAFTAILACAAVVVAAGGVMGTILGGVLTQSVGGGIMDDVESAAVGLATGASLGLTILAGLGCIVLFLALTAIFTATYIGKEPRALLPKDQA